MTTPSSSDVAADPTVADFRTAMGRFATGVTVVTATLDGVDHAMTANSVTSVSLHPLLVAVCVDRTTRFHEAVMGAEGWAVSILGAEEAELARWLAIRGRPLAGQLDGVAHHRGAASGAVLLDPALAALECRPYAAYPGGDHSIVVGRVVAVHAPEGPLPDPLLYYERHYTQLYREPAGPASSD